MGEVHGDLGPEGVVESVAKETHPKRWPQLSPDRTRSSACLLGGAGHPYF